MVIVEKCPHCQQLHAEGQLTCTQEPTEIEVIEEVAFSTAGAPPPSPRSDSLLHETLDERYRITRLLGSGGMGKVYAAEHLVTGKRFAIKVLNPQLANDEEARKRFAREARAINVIEHPHIVELYDYGQTPQGIPFLAMEYMEGMTLRAFLNAAPAVGLPIPQAVSIALQMAQALQHVHERGIVHRDVKPDNIQIEVDSSQNVVAKLFDFGIARIQSQEAVTSAAAGPPRTLAYAAPEMYERKDYLSPAIDVYALGVTLFEILTKQRPFGGSGIEILLGHLKDTPQNVSEVRKDVKLPAELDALITRMLAKKPEQRPTMAEVSDSLAAVTTLLPATSARGLHHLRTYVLPKRLPRRGNSLNSEVSTPGTQTPSVPASADKRSLTQIEAARQQVGAKLEREARGIIKRIYRQNLPADLAELLRRCEELGAQQGEVELDLALLQDTLAQEKAAVLAERQSIRQRLNGVRDELRAVTTMVAGMPGRNIGKELAQLELAYSTQVVSNALVDRVQQQASQQHRISVELVDLQRDLADRLLLAVTSAPDDPRRTGGRMDPNMLLYAKRLNVVLSELDALDEALALLLLPEA